MLSEDQEKTITTKIDRWVNRLLDFSGRNRLLFYKPTKTTTLEIVLPKDRELFDRIVVKGQSLTFPDSNMESPSNSNDNFNNSTNASVIISSAATPLAVRCPPTQLNRILYNLNIRSKTSREEQGINILYLAFGLITWQDSQKGEFCKSPLVLVPVELTREAFGQPYKLVMLEDDLVLNPTLQEALRQFYAIQIPNIDNDLDAPGLSRFFSEIESSIASRFGWKVETNIFLDVFTYQKQMMVADLKEHNVQLKNNSFIQSISLPNIDLPEPSTNPILANQLDDKTAPETTFQILDADSSQQEAIEAAKCGLSFVLQGPPGTGKSQTIANIIAEFLASGKKVLFVSAKMAALEVVQDRMKKTGLGDFCLQVHSHKRNKREVIEELHQSLELPLVITPSYIQAKIQNLQKIRNQLNDYVRALHRKNFSLNFSAYYLYGKLDELRDAPKMQFLIPVTNIDFGTFEEQQLCVQQMMTFTHVIQNYHNHLWYGFMPRDTSLEKRAEIQELLNGLRNDITDIKDLCHKLSQLYGIPDINKSLNEIQSFFYFASCYFPSIMQIPVGELLERFSEKYISVMRFARFQYWQDRNQIKNITRDKQLPNTQKLIVDLKNVLNIQTQIQPINAFVSIPDNGQLLIQNGRILFKQIQVKINKLSDYFDPIERPEYLINITDQDLSVFHTYISDLIDHLDDINEWVIFQNHYIEANRLGITPFIQEAITNHLFSDQWYKGFLYRFYLLFLEEIINIEPILKQLTSETHQLLRDRFCELDRELITSARIRIREKVLSGRPQASWMNASSSEEAILRREINKKRRIKPLRILFSEIPGLILRLRPCLMMSPLTVSQLLDPNKFTFDLVIFDEASQIHTEEAVGAIMRGKQVIIAGDRYQLPPTSFFEALESDVEYDEGNYDEDLESILNEFDAANMPRQMLEWHYRSRDESLIAFSNHHFYADRLLTFPSAHSDQNTGVSFVFVSDGVYQRSGHRNEKEAKKVVEMILEHYQKTPELSLGVVTFSQAQRDTIQIELDQAIRDRPNLQTYFSETAKEPFFVKNLELVQGDERDTMIFSIGYAKDEIGKFILNFGPLNKDGGERRLNVAVTRARYAVKLVASFQPEDIDLTRTSSRGVQLLRSYMSLARDGLKALYADLQVNENADFESPFEAQVFEALSSKGLILKKQVGVSGYRIDMAVVDPKNQGHFLLGIECDGATYHRSATARDRDRLRQEVLENLGWRFHRIWSRDWYENPAKEVAKVLDVLKSNMFQPSKFFENKSHDTDPEIGNINIRTDLALQTAQVQANLPKGISYYHIAKPPRCFFSVSDFNDAPSSRMALLIKAIVDVETPIHTNLLNTRIAEVNGINRIGKRIETSISRGIWYGSQSKLFIQRGTFLWSNPIKSPSIRIPFNNDDRRTIEMICTEELALAIDLCLHSALSLSPDDLIRETARLYKLQSSEKNSLAIQIVITQMCNSHMIEYRENKYYPSK